MPSQGDAVSLAPAEVARFLARRFGGDISTVEPVGHGEWSKAFFFRQAGRDLVCRFSPLDDDFLKDQRVLRNPSARLPMPALLEVGKAFDGYYAISQRAFGEFLELREASAMERVLPSLFDILDALRAVHVSDRTGFGLWRGADGNAPHATWRDALLTVAPSPRTRGWRDRLSRWPESARVFDAGHERLRTLVAVCPNTRHLVHSDLLYFNVLVSGDQVSAVLDWGSAMYADFLWDLAWLTFWQAWYTDWSSVDIRGAALRHYASIGLEVPAFEERMRCYELAIGLDGMAYQAWADHPDHLAWTTNRVSGLLQE